MLNSKKCSLLINTCDNYEDTWIPFFSLLSNYWGECPYSIYLNTEEKNISYFQGANPHRRTGKAGYLFIRLLKQTAKDSALYLIHSSTHRGTGFGDRKFFTPFSPLLILFQDIHTHRLYSEHIALYQDL